jgi:hypothetical protein
MLTCDIVLFGPPMPLEIIEFYHVIDCIPIAADILCSKPLFAEVGLGEIPKFKSHIGVA